MWAYDSWKATVESLRAVVRTGIVVSAYNREECEDDEDMLVSWGLKEEDFLWFPEPNPCRCDVVVLSTEGRELIENCFTLAFRPYKNANITSC